MEDLVVRAPLSGQLSFVKVTPGQQVQSTEAIAEIKVLDQLQIHTSLSDTTSTGSPPVYPPPSPGKTKSTRSGSPKSFRKSKTVTSMSTWSLRSKPGERTHRKKFPCPDRTRTTGRGPRHPTWRLLPATGGQWIYKLNESGTKARKTPVSIGRQNPQQYEITGGLQPGDKVIVTGYSTFGDAEELILK